ncbi:MAG: hypothetical protein U1D33_01405, partial [bacterium]|nr:hypothetical protein [bacterium]
MNLENSVLGQFSVSTQHEYTKKIKTLNISKAADTNCWETTSLQNGGLCLEKSGIFSVRVPLEELGPYTLFVTAARLSGEPAQASARVSRVMAPTVTADVISYEPDISSGGVSEGTGQVKVIIDLLKGCQETADACDFIGAATGGVMVTASNTMTGPPEKKILCATTTVLGGVGRFAIGVPVVPGENQISVSVCNAATGFEKEKCPTLAGRSFRVGGVSPKIEVLNPLAKGPFYWDAESAPSVALRFKVAGYRQTVCDQSVQVSLNTGSPRPVCPDAAGIYQMILQPVPGYNAALIIAETGGEKLTETVPFGWGKSLTPFTPRGNVKPEEEWKLKNALQLWLPKSWINDFWVEKLNLFFDSDDFRKMAADFADAPVGPEKTDADRESLTENLPGYCRSGGNDLKIRLMAPPSFKKLSLKRLQFEEKKLRLPLSAQNMSLKVQ